MFCSCFLVLCIFIFACTSVALLPPGESPIAVSNNNNNNNSNNNNNNNNRWQEYRQGYVRNDLDGSIYHLTDLVTRKRTGVIEENHPNLSQNSLFRISFEPGAF
jgi:hypothetical protein